MQQIKVDVQGIRINSQNDGTHHLMLIALNAMWADILQHTLGDRVVLKYNYDGQGITFDVIFELPVINKTFSVQANANTHTLKWLNWIDDKKVTVIRVAFRDGKGGPILFGNPVVCSFTL